MFAREHRRPAVRLQRFGANVIQTPQAQTRPVAIELRRDLLGPCVHVSLIAAMGVNDVASPRALVFMRNVACVGERRADGSEQANRGSCQAYRRIAPDVFSESKTHMLLPTNMLHPRFGLSASIVRKVQLISIGKGGPEIAVAARQAIKHQTSIATNAIESEAGLAEISRCLQSLSNSCPWTINKIDKLCYVSQTLVKAILIQYHQD